MFHWLIREELSARNRLRRSYYELLRDDLDDFIVQYALIDSYNNFKQKNKPYPFAAKRELKPRAQLPKIEYGEQNTFLVVFVEDTIPDTCKKHIRFFDVNRTTKTNLMQADSLALADNFDRTEKFMESARFNNFLKELLPLDYALLIQRDPTTVAADHYNLSHFHVRIDWPIASAAEDLGQYLRYISKDLYEKGDKYAETLQKKLFEYYGFPFMVGGRRTAALVAAQFLKQLPCISTVYVASSEARHVTRLSERGVSKFALVKLSKQEMTDLAARTGLAVKDLTNNYVIATEGTAGIFVLRVAYMRTEHSRFPSEKKLRTVRMSLPWLTVGNQHILPRTDIALRRKFSPLPVNVIYAENLEKKS
ncbi:MAG: hypothetical protein AB1724_02675 [Thermodesulfobacteriota bacterium]